MAEIWLTSLDGSLRLPTMAIGPYGAHGDLSYSTRFGSGACGMFEASWSMPLPADFDHPLLRRGTLVELMDGPWRMGSPLVLTEPARGSGFDNPWTLTATGIGREVEGENSFYALDGSGNVTADPAVAIDQAIARGLRWKRDSAGWPAAVGTDPPLQSIGALLSTITDTSGVRWGVQQDGTVRFMGNPTTPTYHVVPGVAALGVADDDYATAVYVRYLNSGAGGAAATVRSPATVSATETRYGRREYPVDLTGDTGPGQISTAVAQSYADGILAKYGGRLGWTNGLTLTSNEILTAGGVPADLSMVAEDVGNGCMVRLHGIFDDLLETTGNTFLDVVIGEAKLADGAQTIDLSPLGLAARDLASVVESVTGMASAA